MEEDEREVALTVMLERLSGWHQRTWKPWLTSVLDTASRERSSISLVSTRTSEDGVNSYQLAVCALDLLRCNLPHGTLEYVERGERKTKSLIGEEKNEKQRDRG